MFFSVFSKYLNSYVCCMNFESPNIHLFIEVITWDLRSLKVVQILAESWEAWSILAMITDSADLYLMTGKKIQI